MTTVQIDLTKAEPLEYDVVSEPWNKYKLEDGTLLFAKLVVTKVLRTSQCDLSGNPIYTFNSQNLFYTMAPKELKGKPSNPLPSSTNVADYKHVVVDIETKEPQWNVYKLSDGTLLRAKLELTSVVRTDQYTMEGDPFYIVVSGSITRTKVPENLRQKSGPKFHESIYR